MIRVSSFSNTQRQPGRALPVLVSILAILLLTACGSTKVYNNDKTVVYNGAVYNLSKVIQINSKATAKLSDSQTVNLKGVERKQFDAYIKEHGSIFVRMAFELDDQEMLYRASSVDSWNQYQNMQKSFESAGKQITSLLGDKKKMQLKLK